MKKKKEPTYIDYLVGSIKQQEAFKVLITDILFSCPIEGHPQIVTKFEGAEQGHDCIIIETRGQHTKWRHKIYTEEI